MDDKSGSFRQLVRNIRKHDEEIADLRALLEECRDAQNEAWEAIHHTLLGSHSLFDEDAERLKLARNKLTSLKPKLTAKLEEE